MRRFVSMDPVGILNACTMNVRMNVARMKATTRDSRYSRATDFLKWEEGEGADAMRRHFSLVSAEARRSQQPLGIQAGLEGPADVLDEGRRVAVVESLVVRAHAVLRAEAAPELRDRQLVDPRLQLGLELRRGAGGLLFLPYEVQVDPAAPPVAEVADTDEGIFGGDAQAGRLHEGG